MPTSTLFDMRPAAPTPSSRRKLPVFWIRKLRVISALQAEHELVREVEFKLGLNIINTKAPARGKDKPVVGHSVGKSLLSRLIRYCLGEPGYGDRSLRQSVTGFLRHGYVVADIAIGDTDWFVARPVGYESSASQSWATKHSFERLLDEKKRKPFEVFTDQLAKAVLKRVPEIQLPNAERELRWLDVLTWLTPDQACAHKSHVEWRPGGHDVSSRALKIEDCHVLIRTVMDLLSFDDSSLIGDHKSLLRRQGKLSNEVTLKRAVCNHWEEELVEAYPDAANGLTGELLADKVQSDSAKQKESLARLLDDFGTDPVTEWQESNDALQKSIGAKEQSLKRQGDDLKLLRAELAIKEKPESNELIENSQKGEWCRLFTTEQQALAKGCPGKGDDDTGLKNPKREQEIRDLKSKIEDANSQIETLQGELGELAEQAAESQESLVAARKQVSEREEPLRQKIEFFDQLENNARRYGRYREKFSQLEKSLQDLKPALRSSLDQRRSLTQRYEKNSSKLAANFGYVLSELSGKDVDARIEMNANGIFPRFTKDSSYRGEALSTSAVLAFDLSCMAASIEGTGFHPRFIFHDSPRDADMEVSLYHRLFELVAGLEDLFDDEPSFQYIITTTTMPPKELIESEKGFVRLTLDRRVDDGLLLKTDF